MPRWLPVRIPKEEPARRHALPRHMADSLLNLSGVLIYLWLQNGRGFWYYLDEVRGERVLGYAWTSQGWRRQAVAWCMIWSYY